ncbi:hypothetical protein RHGRI_011591 [Rhododendron griersonianum]|uniref:Uncharacterized protein n=1 Tax=Rhododendron griersonianum TaxID=479676 RepID=A0AAV6KMP5_9ERIC|nr:hypothetical protein RHGRI_011591 [Rhododendron griersonianum]
MSMFTPWRNHLTNCHPKTSMGVFDLANFMIEVMKVYGGNNYKLPHMREDGTLPSQLCFFALSLRSFIFQFGLGNITHY